MNSRKITILWSISLFIISVVTLILSVTSIIGIELPDIATRVVGVLDLIVLPIFVFSTIKKLKIDRN